ncbi:MAG: head GIN domain-containing protein [Flavobacteriaceae bacterium]
MKNLTFIFILTTFLGWSQEKNVGDFNKVTAFDQIDVILIPSTENKVLLNGSGSDEVELVNKNGELKIRMPLTKMLSGDEVSATVYYKSISAVEVNEGSHIGSESVIHAQNFSLIAKEGGSIDLPLEVEQLQARLGDGSKVNLSGKASEQDVLINSGSEYQAENLHTSKTMATANAGGQAHIYATDYVDAKVRAGGEITVYGNPKNIDKKVVMGGKIRQAGK